jgi:hypothetical protein
VIRVGVVDVNLRASELHRKGLQVKLQEQPFRVLAMLSNRRLMAESESCADQEMICLRI